MRLSLKYNLPFVSLVVTQKSKSVLLPFVLIDTGSASTIFSIDHLDSIEIYPESNDSLHQIRGVGGVETVFLRKIDTIALAEMVVNDFNVEVGAMDYGFDIQGIIGMDFLCQTSAIIDLSVLEIRFEKN